MALWSSDDAAKATGGRNTGEWQATGVSIDTRSIQPGELFVALSDTRDGHDFVAQAFQKGAAAVLVSRVPENLPENLPLLIVDDVLPALEAMGRAARERMQGKVIGVTGSVGKTSTKEMLRAALARQGKLHAAEASYNNHWGVPLTLARMPRDSDFAIIEIGMSNPGEIAPLARMARPHAALITTIAAAHMAAFEGLDGIAREKAAIFSGLVPGGAAIIPTGLSTTPILREAADDVGAPILSFGDDGEARLISSEPDGETLRVRAALSGKPINFTLQSVGPHFAANSIGVLATVSAIGADVIEAAKSLADWTPPKGRGRVEQLGGIRLIDDAFNANPSSMRAGLGTVSRLPGARRVAILGDMLELGGDEAEQHRLLASDPAMEAIGIVHSAGPLMRHMHDALPAEKRGVWSEKADDLASRLDELVREGDTVIVKGSKGSYISRVVDAMRKAGNMAGNTGT
ncbi:UDP-N-acetylmuramoyl-tripeptide--D-alanyl-D-alanine ligase [Paracoccus aerodenitrificans]|uniref:UDP-N-acetylmuramoyl-tripeptide--D-alanyl-D- alanine ligase n=1 Tax=Paracoccus aerodenitrificans TaxID=3017781 RepID=UPI0022F0C7C4|nr:UDP-N-acetylmuramoyl-tripeptide--D-alanyl-D-alanine ligase [Paracoccus aerodenitrificans]WBU63145.1 UDP-N-acetylmuramoyl-tripeptide--D-alanyl-D-alanine ligase [Paracoccus aerodenitrificans]